MPKRRSKNKVVVPSPIIHVDYKSLKTELDNNVERIKNLCVNWLIYIGEGSFTADDLRNLSEFEDLSVRKKVEMFKKNPNGFSLVFLRFIDKIYNNDAVQHVIVLFEDIFTDNREVISIFYKQTAQSEYDVLSILLSLTKRDCLSLQYLVRRFISKLIGSQKFVFTKAQANLYLKMLINDLKIAKNPYTRDCLQIAKRIFLVHDLRLVFARLNGLAALVEVLSNTRLFTFQYDGIFALWLLSFNQSVTDKLVNLNVINLIAHILRETNKSKIIRISLSFYCNIMSKATKQKLVITQLLGARIQDVIKTIDKSLIDDQDVLTDFAFVRNYVDNGIEDLTNFDEYSAEIKNRKLEWTPTHKSERFWKENTMKFCDNNYEILKILVDIILNDTEPQNVSIALYDIGEFVRHYQRGKFVVEQLGGKMAMMRLLQHSDTNVRYEALIAIQKFLVQNWEFLGRHLDARISMQPLASKDGRKSLFDD